MVAVSVEQLADVFNSGVVHNGTCVPGRWLRSQSPMFSRLFISLQTNNFVLLPPSYGHTYLDERAAWCSQ